MLLLHHAECRKRAMYDVPAAAAAKRKAIASNNNNNSLEDGERKTVHGMGETQYA